jgi:phage terminase large subunit-like protein
MPHQRQIVDTALEVDEAGRPFYRECVVLLPRQHGKSVLTLAWMLQRALRWPDAQRIAYSAQTGFDARRKLLDDFAPMLLHSRFDAVVSKLNRRAGNEGVEFKTGSRIDVIASSESAGHGRTLDLAILDEAFADQDNRREQAILPAMATRPAAQMLLVSTAGTDSSVFLRRKVDAGRAAVLENADRGIAYFEWSASEDADPDDERVWWETMPALGHTISVDVVRHAQQTMSEGDFRRAYLNQWTVADERVIPAAVWDAVCASDVAPSGRLVFGLDVSADRDAAALVAADEHGVCELVEARAGTSWLVGRAVELARKWNAPVVLDAFGPAGTFGEAIEAQGVTVDRYASRQVSMACAALFDSVADRRVRVRSSERLSASVAGAHRRVSGDSWFWGRRNAQVDVSPLVALTLAFDRATRASGREVDLSTQIF